MNKKSLFIVALAAICLTAVPFLEFTHATSMSYIRVKPEATTVGVGVTFSVNVTFEDVPQGSSGAVGCQFTLNWDPSILNCSSIQEVAFHKVAPVSEWDNIWILLLMINNTGGFARYAVVWYDDQRAVNGGYAFISGNGTWATLSFNGKAPGQTNLTLTNAIYGDINATVMPLTVANGNVTVTGQKLATTVRFNLNPNPALVGGTITLLGNLTTVTNVAIPAAAIALRVNGAQVGTLTTNSAGWFTASGQVGSAGTYNVSVVYAGSSAYYPSSNWTILTVNKVQTEMYAKLFPNLASPGAPGTLKGILIDQLNNPVKSANISVQYSSDYGLTWIQLGSTSTNSYGIFSYGFTAPSVGTYVYRMSYAGSTANMPCITDITLVVR